MDILLILSLSALVIAGLAARYQPERRRQMLFGALFSLPIIGIELLAAGSFQRLGISTADSLRYLVLVTVGVMSTGALAALLADLTVNRWLTPAVHHHRHQLWWLLIGVGVVAIAVVLGQPIGAALMLGLTVNVSLLLFLDRDLLWDALVGAVAFAGWFALADVLFGIHASGDINLLLLGAHPLGLTLAGLPIERVLIGMMAGALVGPLFSATKFNRAPTLERKPIIPTTKIVVGMVVVGLMTVVMVWATYAFVVPPRVQAASPLNDATKVATSSALTFSFDRAVDRNLLQLAISPAAEGVWKFSQPTYSDHGFRQAQFVFDEPLKAGTTYRIHVKNISSVWGFASPSLDLSFTTKSLPEVAKPVAPPVVEPPVPTPTPDPTPTPTPSPAPAPVPAPEGKTLSIGQDYQDQPLSCEAAALKMALAGKGVRVSEDEIMKIVGYDPTPHEGDVWGNPNVAFVGNIAGKQNTTGYGVYWGPIARAAKHWRSAEAFSNWTPTKLANEISQGNPVVIWGVIGRAYRDDWHLPNGDLVVAWKGEHARTVIGYRGSVDNPTSFVLNDPVAGRIVWSTATLKSNWSAFSNSGVVVR